MKYALKYTDTPTEIHGQIRAEIYEIIEIYGHIEKYSDTLTDI